MPQITFVNSYNEIVKHHNYNIGLFSLAGILKKAGYTVNIIDIDYLITKGILIKTNNLETDIQIISDFIMNENPNIIDFYTLSNSYFFTIKLAHYIKTHYNVKVILGGPQSTVTAYATLSSCNWIDAIGIGEGELTIVPIINKLMNNQTLSDEKGVAFINNEKIVINETCLMNNLDNLPLIDYSLFKGDIPKTLEIEIGRGCPFSCKFCMTNNFWKKNYRLKSPFRVINEIQDIQKSLNINQFIFEHDMFTVERDKVISFCKYLIEKKILINWSCSSRIDTLDEDLIKVMKEAGCSRIFLGIESGSEYIQKVIKKNLKINKIIEVTQLLIQHNIKVVASFMFGFPEETKKDIEKTIDLIYKLRMNGIQKTQLHKFTIFPGTQYFDELQDSLSFSETSTDSSATIYRHSITFEQVKKHPNMYAQYFDFNIENKLDYDYLDIYIMFFSEIIMTSCNLTYSYMYKKFGSHLDLYDFYKSANKNNLKDKQYLINSLSIDKMNQLNCFSKVIDKLEESTFKYIVKELYRFESDIIKFIIDNKNEKDIKIYLFDVYDLKQNGKITDFITNYETKLLFIRTSKTGLRIEKLKNP